MKKMNSWVLFVRCENAWHPCENHSTPCDRHWKNYRGFILPQRKLRKFCLGYDTDVNSHLSLPRFQQLDSPVRSHRHSCPAVGSFTTSLLRSLPFILSSQSITSLIIRSCQVSICPGHFLLSNSSCSQ